MSADGLAVTEAALAERLGLHRKELRRVRREVGLQKEGRVVLEEHEWLDMAEALGIGLDSARAAFTEAGVADGVGLEKKTAGGGNEAVLTHCAMKNRRIMLAELEDGAGIRVRVGDASRFRPGMKVPVRQVSGSLYEFTGRLPKSRRVYFGGVRA